jgi:hypothetical protein
MTEHFRFEIIPAGRWSRLNGTTAQGGSDEPRPHLIPATEDGRKLVEIDASGFIGRTGLCPGEVTLEDGSKTLAYRFINLDEENAERLIAELGTEIDNLKRAARD